VRAAEKAFRKDGDRGGDQCRTAISSQMFRLKSTGFSTVIYADCPGAMENLMPESLLGKTIQHFILKKGAVEGG
jgi:hypothetical protein